MDIETKSEAVTKHDETISALLENHKLLVTVEERQQADHNMLIVVDERQQTVLKRLDKVNGTVADYNANKFRIDIAESAIKLLCDNFTKLDDKYINTKAFKLIIKITTVLGSILGIIISASIVLQLLKII